MKRSGFTAKPSWRRLARGTGMKRSRVPINAVSEKRKHENAERAQIPMDDRCAAVDAPGDCFGPLTKHEILPRGRGGSITDPANIATVCAEHNRKLSQDVETMRWGLEHDLLKHGWDG